MKYFTHAAAFDIIEGKVICLQFIIIVYFVSVSPHNSL